MTETLVTIVVNVFNGAACVGECLESILALRGPAIRVLVVDDASGDDTPAILARYRDPCVELIRLPQNVGAAAAISYAFTHVRTPYVARIDYDDRYHPNFLVDSLGVLERYPDAAFVCADAQMIGPNGEVWDRCGPGQYGELPGCRDRFASMLSSNFVTAPTILGRTQHWQRAMPVPAGMDFCDWYMNLSMAERAPVAVIDTVTADYRVHPANMHTTKVTSGMGERVTFQVLERFLDHSQRSAELRGGRTRILAKHYAEWGDRYFGAGMNADALRCYQHALRLAPSLLWRGNFLHRQFGLVVGREQYERGKRVYRRLRMTFRREAH